VPVGITAPGGAADAGVEPFLFLLSNGQPAGLAEPTSAPIHIIDVEGVNRVSLEPTLTGGPMAYQGTEFGSVLIPVFWAGTGSGGSVNYTVEPDPAKPATPGEDFTVASPNPLPITNRVGFIQIDIVGDKLREGGRVRDHHPPAGALHRGGALLQHVHDHRQRGERLPGQPVPPPPEQVEVQQGRLSHPGVPHLRHRRGRPGVVAAEMALRRNLKNGKCAWKAKKGWQKKDCQNRTWLPTKYDDVGELFYYRMKQLKSSVGTKIKNYTAFSRAIDGAGNVERDFIKKRNENTFEIKRSKRKGRR
jgi:hypothetical protein